MAAIVLALSAALSWGSGDFAGGFAARRLNQFQVLFLTALSSLLMLVLAGLVAQESLPSLHSLIFAALAGISGAFGLASLYRGLSIGNAALVAPVTGVIAAIIPVLTGLALEGIPGVVQFIGITLALLGIWMVTRFSAEEHIPEDPAKNPGGGNASTVLAGGENASFSPWHLRHSAPGLAILAGIGFGGFLALIAQVEQEQVFVPLIVAKTASVLFAMGVVWSRKQSLPKPNRSPVALLSGVLDAGGNMFYLFATQFTRLDTAAILASFYPVATVLLSNIILKERVSSQQWIGILFCIGAIMLLSM
jgi:drug/metabolite transporter (DMT)-like permease